MEIRQRIQSAPRQAIVLVLALIAAVAIALTITAVRLSAPVHPQNDIVTPWPHVVGVGMETGHPGCLPTIPNRKRPPVNSERHTSA